MARKVSKSTTSVPTKIKYILQFQMRNHQLLQGKNVLVVKVLTAAIIRDMSVEPTVAVSWFLSASVNIHERKILVLDILE